MAKIYLDVGHGGKDVGAVKGDRYESNDNLSMSLKVAEILHSWGHEVYLSRETDIFIDVEERPRQANELNCDYFLSIHRNAFEINNGDGLELWINSVPTDDERYIASDILVQILNVADFKSRGVKLGYRTDPKLDYAVNRIFKGNSALIEIGFITNDKDNEIFDTKFNEIANAIATGICKHKEWNMTVEKDKLYRVQVGAYRNKEYAQAHLERLQEKGEYGYIVEVEV